MLTISSGWRRDKEESAVTFFRVAAQFFSKSSVPRIHLRFPQDISHFSATWPKCSSNLDITSLLQAAIPYMPARETVSYTAFLAFSPGLIIIIREQLRIPISCIRSRHRQPIVASPSVPSCIIMITQVGFPSILLPRCVTGAQL